jgi:hypothetical protein
VVPVVLRQFVSTFGYAGWDTVTATQQASEVSP